MIEMELTIALQQAGCPICRLRQHSEARYLANTLNEGIMDSAFRVRFVYSEGLCLTHAWELQALEQNVEQDGLGVAVLYEALLKVITPQLSELAAQPQPSSQPWWQPTRKSPELRLPAAIELCPICAASQRTEETFTYFLAEFLQQESWRTTYQASNGLCLPHLRQTLAQATPDVGQWLLTDSIERLKQVQQDLGEYIRKHAYQFHDEVMSAAEQDAWIRTVAILRGERPHSREGLYHGSRQKPPAHDSSTSTTQGREARRSRQDDDSR